MIGKHKLSITAAIVLASALLGCSRSEWDTGRWWRPWTPPRSECGARWGRLNIDQEIQIGSRWCWVATVSEVLKWYHLPNADQCHLYDLSRGTSTCDLLENNPLWKPASADLVLDSWGTPEDAASIYRANYHGRISVNVRRRPFNGPLSFSEIKAKICPADGSLGTPYIWAYDNITALHDVVVKGYMYLKPQVGSSLPPNSIERAGLFTELVDVHDPNSPLEPSIYDYIYYDDGWAEEVMISNISIYADLAEFLNRY